MKMCAMPKYLFFSFAFFFCLYIPNCNIVDHHLYTLLSQIHTQTHTLSLIFSGGPCG